MLRAKSGSANFWLLALAIMPPRKQAPKSKGNASKPKLTPSKANRPDIETDIRACEPPFRSFAVWLTPGGRPGNKSWEDELAIDYGPNSTIVRCTPNDAPRRALHLEERRIHNRCATGQLIGDILGLFHSMSKRKHLLQYNRSVSGA